jgi:hypothetical protein
VQCCGQAPPFTVVVVLSTVVLVTCGTVVDDVDVEVAVVGVLVDVLVDVDVLVELLVVLAVVDVLVDVEVVVSTPTMLVVASTVGTPDPPVPLPSGQVASTSVLWVALSVPMFTPEPAWTARIFTGVPAAVGITSNVIVGVTSVPSTLLVNSGPVVANLTRVGDSIVAVPVTGAPFHVAVPVVWTEPATSEPPLTPTLV